MSEARITEALATIPVSVITGFLGSGKTTLLKALLARPEMRDTAVLINEFGEVGLDHLLVQQVTEEIVLLNSGCICCTVREDLVQSLRELFIRRLRGEVPSFRRVAIETTGLADPAPVIQTLITDVTLADRYRVDGIVTTVDAVLGSDQLDRHPESVKQAAVADRLVLTKVDLAPAAARDLLRRRLKDINPGAALIEAVNGEVEPAALLNVGLYDPETKSADVRRWLNDAAYALADAENHDHGHGHGDGHDHEHDHGHGHDHRHHSVNRHDDHIGAFCLVHDRPIPWHGFVTFLEALLATQGQNVLRIKGLLNVIGQDRPIVVHGVQHVFHPPAALPAWPDADRSSRIVFITHDIGRAAVEQTFRTFIQAALEAEAGAATDAESTSGAAGRDR